MPQQSTQKSLAADATDARGIIGDKPELWPCGGIGECSIAEPLRRAVGVVDARCSPPKSRVPVALPVRRRLVLHLTNARTMTKTMTKPLLYMCNMEHLESVNKELQLADANVSYRKSGV